MRTVRKPFIAGNWKMHNTHPEAAALAAAVAGRLGTPPARVMLAPPFTALATVGEALRGTSLELGAQNVNPEAAGAHTGEISCAMLQALGVGVVIVGHSERRHGYGEDDALITRKVTAAVSAGLEVVLCVGETLAEREAGVAEAVVGRQLRAASRPTSAARSWWDVTRRNCSALPWPTSRCGPSAPALPRRPATPATCTGRCVPW